MSRHLSVDSSLQVSVRADSDSLSPLVDRSEALPADAHIGLAHQTFVENSAAYAIAIVDKGDRPIGLINRFRFFEALARASSRDLLMQRHVTAVMDSSPLIVDEQIPVNQLSDVLVDDRAKYIFDGFIVTRNGIFIGIGTGYSLMRRLTERNQSELFHLAHHDALTGLANRQLFGERLRQALAHSDRRGHPLAVLFLDVDRFKAINDSFGHTVGDLVLQGIAARLTTGIRTHDTVARLSGDEFAIVLTELGLASHGELVARKLVNVMRQPHAVDGHEIIASCSIGVAVYPQDAGNEAALLRAADDAAYHAKQFRNTCHRYSADMQRTHPDGLFSVGSVQRAIDLHQLEVHYQPQIHGRTRTLYGVEALVRWRDPIQGLLPTPELIATAEDTGLISDISEFVLETSMRQMLEWQRARLMKQARLAVNISGVEIRDGALIPMLRRHLAKTQFHHSALELEITETTMMRSDPSTLTVLNEVKQLGIRLSVDDFGTGYSSLGRLQGLPLDGLKIDKTFVRGIENNGDGGALAKAIIVMGHSLGLAVTAEGVETARQMAFLEAHGCDHIQGYYVSPPLTPSEMFEYLTRLS